MVPCYLSQLGLESEALHEETIDGIRDYRRPQSCQTESDAKRRIVLGSKFNFLSRFVLN